MRVTSVRIRRRQVGNREFDSITISLCDLHLSCDLMDDRQIKNARKLADEHGAWFEYDEANAERVRSVLGISATKEQAS